MRNSLVDHIIVKLYGPRRPYSSVWSNRPLFASVISMQNKSTEYKKRLLEIPVVVRRRYKRYSYLKER